MSPIFYVNGSLTVTPAPLTITANDAFRSQGAPNPTFTVGYNGFRNGDTSSLVRSVLVTTPADSASVPGYYAIIPSGATAPNYSINYVDGTLSVGIIVLPPTVQAVIGLRTVPEAPTMSISNPSLPPMEWPSEAPVNPDNLVNLAPAAGPGSSPTPGQIPSGDWMVDSEIDNQYRPYQEGFLSASMK